MVEMRTKWVNVNNSVNVSVSFDRLFAKLMPGILKSILGKQTDTSGFELRD